VRFRWVSQAAKCVYATSSRGAASIGVSHSRGNNAPGSGARSDGRCVRWSRRAYRIRGRTAPAPASSEGAPICRGPVLDAGHRSLGVGAALPLRACDTKQPIAGPIVCRRRAIVRPPPWIRRAIAGQRQRFDGPLTWLRRAVHIPGVLAWTSLPGGDQFFARNLHFRTANDFLAACPFLVR
jgi:hypothetical protein